MYAVSAWLISEGDGKQGHLLSLGTSSILTTVMGMRYYKGRKLFPAGVLTGAGGLSTIYHGVSVIPWL